MKYLKAYESFLLEAFDLNKLYNQQKIIPQIQIEAKVIVNQFFNSVADIPTDMKRDRDKVVLWVAKQIKQYIIRRINNSILHTQEQIDMGVNNSSIWEKAHNEYKQQLECAKGNSDISELPTAMKSELENSISYFKGVFNSMLTLIFDYFLSPARNQHERINFVNSTLEDMDRIQIEWHNSLKASNRILKESGNIIMTFPDGYYWIDLQTNISIDEAVAMGHCGRTSANTILSLRRKSDAGHIEPFVTIAIDYTKGSKKKSYSYIRQIKGKGNTKPVAKYHPYIVDLLTNDELGMYKVNNDEYSSENDFHLNDIINNEALCNKILQNKPELFRLPGLFLAYIKGFIPSSDVTMEIEYLNFENNAELSTDMLRLKNNKVYLVFDTTEFAHILGSADIGVDGSDLYAILYDTDAEQALLYDIKSDVGFDITKYAGYEDGYEYYHIELDWYTINSMISETANDYDVGVFTFMISQFRDFKFDYEL
jgi:hypothetical protein